MRKPHVWFQFGQWWYRNAGRVAAGYSPDRAWANWIKGYRGYRWDFDLSRLRVTE